MTAESPSADFVPGFGERLAEVAPPPPPIDTELRRNLKAPATVPDKIFRGIVRTGGLAVLVVMALIALFLGIRSTQALHRTGWHFLTEQRWQVGANHFGIAGALPGGILIAVVALIIGVPVALATALFISEYAPARMRRPLISVIDLMAAVPSIVYGMWGLVFLQPIIIGPIRFFSGHFGFIPFFKVRDAGGDSSYTSSAFIAGVVVGLMIIPIVTALSREIFSQAPIGEREAAYALGSTRWGMIRSVVVPYSRGGVIGAMMLGFGRAMGETITVALILSIDFRFDYHVFEGQGISIPALIANRYTDSAPLSLSALMAAGLVLFVITLTVNALAAIVISRSRSSARTT